MENFEEVGDKPCQLCKKITPHQLFLPCSELEPALQETLTIELDLNMADTVLCKICEAVLTRGVPPDHWPGGYTEAELDKIRQISIQQPNPKARPNAGRKREPLLSPNLKKKFVLHNRPELREAKDQLESFAIEHHYDIKEVLSFFMWHSLYSSGERKRAKGFLGELNVALEIWLLIF